jgi:hypothetical protein
VVGEQVNTEHLLRNLLAIVFRDGGQRTDSFATLEEAEKEAEWVAQVTCAMAERSSSLVEKLADARMIASVKKDRCTECKEVYLILSRP